MIPFTLDISVSSNADDWAMSAAWKIEFKRFISPPLSVLRKTSNPLKVEKGKKKKTVQLLVLRSG